MSRGENSLSECDDHKKKISLTSESRKKTSLNPDHLQTEINRVIASVIVVYDVLLFIDDLRIVDVVKEECSLLSWENYFCKGVRFHHKIGRTKADSTGRVFYS